MYIALTKTRIGVALCWICMQVLVFGQDTIRVNLVHAAVEFPYVPQDHEIVLASVGHQPTHNAYRPREGVYCDFYYSIPIESIVGYDAGLLSTLASNSRNVEFCLCRQGKNGGEFSLFLENAETPAGLDRSRMHGVEKTPFFIRAALSDKNDPRLRVDLPMEATFIFRYGIPELHIRSLMKLQLEAVIADSVLKVDLLYNLYGVNYKYHGFNIPTRRIEDQNVLLGEPIFFHKRLVKISKVDVMHATAEVILLREGERPIGFREGYYLPLGEWLSRIDGEFKQADSSLSYYLLYVWGPWCQPCIERLPALEALTRKIAVDSSIRTILLAAILSDREKSLVDGLTRKHGLPISEIVSLRPEHTEAYANDPNAILTMLHQERYPEYILLNHEGKILYRGLNEGNELSAWLDVLR